MTLKDPSPLDDPEDNSHKGNDKENVDQASGMEGEKSDCPADDQDNCNDIK